MCMGSWQQKHFRKSTLIPLLSKSTSSCVIIVSYRFQRKMGDVSDFYIHGMKRFTGGEICVPFAMFLSGFDISPLLPNKRSHAFICTIVDRHIFLFFNSSLVQMLRRGM